MSKCYNVLWTGGWDSTFRMIQLASRNESISPYYILDVNRASSLKEVKAIKIIMDKLIKKYPGCSISPLKILFLDDISIPGDIKKAYDKLKSIKHLGTQYIWIAALSRKIEDLELSIHEDDKATFFVNRLYENNTQTLNENILFGSLKFPILKYTKYDMEAEASLTNDVEILYDSWFCYDPVNSMPCGLCNPCVYSMDEGMKKRFDKRGLIYYKYPLLFGKLRRIAKHYF